MFRVAIIDDEPLARTAVRASLREWNDIEIVGEADNGRDAVALIRATKPDLVFLDVRMPILDGFGVIEEVAEYHLPVIIFLTAYDQYALRAFEAHATDYLSSHSRPAVLNRPSLELACTSLVLENWKHTDR